MNETWLQKLPIVMSEMAVSNFFLFIPPSFIYLSFFSKPIPYYILYYIYDYTIGTINKEMFALGILS